VLPYGALWRSTAIGVMMNNVFPLRAGEFARAFALTREAPKVAMTTALGSLAVDRIFDALVVFLLMFAAMLDPRFPDGATVAGRPMSDVAVSGVALVGTALMVCYVVVLRPAWVTGVAGAVAGRVLPRQRDAIVGFVELAVGSLGVLRDTRRFASVFIWTVLHWLTHAFALHLGFLAVGVRVRSRRQRRARGLRRAEGARGKLGAGISPAELRSHHDPRRGILRAYGAQRARRHASAARSRPHVTSTGEPRALM
jgi:uncharacterized membrane protein YbhN (UPF0104 family)